MFFNFRLKFFDVDKADNSNRIFTFERIAEGSIVVVKKLDPPDLGVSRSFMTRRIRKSYIFLSPSVCKKIFL